jgi:hypothetical protein
MLVCSECGKPAPEIDDVAITEWEGGSYAYFLADEEDDPLMPGLVCPDCMEDEGVEDDE